MSGTPATVSPCDGASEPPPSFLRLHADCRRRPSGRSRGGLRRSRGHGREVQHERTSPMCGNACRWLRRRGRPQRVLGNQGTSRRRGGGKDEHGCGLPSRPRVGRMSPVSGGLWWQVVPPLRGQAGFRPRAAVSFGSPLHVELSLRTFEHDVSREGHRGRTCQLLLARHRNDDAMLQDGKPRRATGAGCWQQHLVATDARTEQGLEVAETRWHRERFSERQEGNGPR